MREEGLVFGEQILSAKPVPSTKYVLIPVILGLPQDTHLEGLKARPQTIKAASDLGAPYCGQLWDAP